MIAVYFAMAVISSVLGLVWGAKFEDDVYWSHSVLRLSFLMQILFEIAGGTAFFVTVVTFGLLNPQFQFRNVNEHLVTSATLLVELSLNTMRIRWEHVILNGLWTLAYCLYIWSAVATHKVTNWPYSFLDVSTSGCFSWYLALLFANVLFYSLWYLLYVVRDRCARKCCCAHDRTSYS